MKLLLLDIPEAAAALAGWLERHLAGPDLGALVAELAAVHGTGTRTTIGDLLGPNREAVLARGLGVLTADALRQLLRRPKQLLELQELVLSEGGLYWQQLSGGDARLATLALRGERRLEELLAAQESSRAVLTAASHSALHSSWYRRPWVVSMATAAAVLAVVFFWPRRPGLPPPLSPSESPPLARKPPTPAPSGWGWDRPGALPEDAGPADYLRSLADAAEQWFKKRPVDPAALAKRIGEMRQGCSTLIFAEHKPLAPEDRRWLVRRCKGWAAQLDKERAALEAGRPVAQVRGEADAIVTEMANVLRTRADSL